MSPETWTDLAGMRVGIWGLGIEGQASVRRLRTLGADPVLVDDNPGSESIDGLQVLATEGGGLEALAQLEVVIKTPGISRYRLDVRSLEEAGVRVTGGLALWLAAAPLERVLCITGTKGKSTTSAIAGHLLERLGHRARVVGNFGQPPYDPEFTHGEDGTAEPVHWIVEVSSFQAADLTCAPPVVAVTSLHPDHLDWHRTIAAYFADKLSLCTRPGARVTVANGSDALLREHRSLLGSEVEWIEGPAEEWTRSLGLPGAHNARNASIARASLRGMGVAPDDDELARAAEDFAPLNARLEELGTSDGVTFVDDGLSTNVLPTIAALDAYVDRRVALLLGGQDRGIEYDELARALGARQAACAVFSIPPGGARITETIRRIAGDVISVTDAFDLDEATSAAAEWARPDGVVLLSPAAPSFGPFRNYRERSAAFADSVRRITGGIVPAETGRAD